MTIEDVRSALSQQNLELPEGRVEQGAGGLDVGDRVRVKLIHTDPERGFIDFARTAAK